MTCKSPYKGNNAVGKARGRRIVGPIRPTLVSHPQARFCLSCSSRSALSFAAADHALGHQYIDLTLGISEFGQYLGCVLAEFRRHVPHTPFAAREADRRGHALVPVL